ncbi:MAG: Rieske 2Fe-2S domain-containing protein [Immundisolibacteraceae bacterium]|nr:Rieske 2Fe-2S domain-containing protein [Immundisolibacteraceae bacterium]
MNNPSFNGLSQPEANHIQLYSDPELFELELERIFYSTWVFIAHESEIPEPGDFKTTFIGRVPVLLTRDDDSNIHVLLNRCTHRGATVCPNEQGNTKQFVCAYHAWTYDLDGSLNAVGLPSGYNEGEVDYDSLSLQKVANTGVYRGFIFATMSESARPFDEHIGGVKKYIDYYCDLSPTGEITVGTTGIYKQKYEGNWKIQLEGSVEGYHVWHTHKNAIDVMAREVPLMKDYPRLPVKAYDLGFGHNIIENYTLTEEQVHQRWPADFIDSLVKAHGRQRAMDALKHRFNLVIFPNFALLEYHVRVIRPLAVDRTEVRTYHTSLVGAPEQMNQRRVREHEFFYGPAGFGGPDDYVIFDRIQQGYDAWGSQWVLFNRGYKSEQTDADGIRSGAHTQETQQRAPYYEYRQLMGISGTENKLEQLIPGAGRQGSQ